MFWEGRSQLAIRSSLQLQGSSKELAADFPLPLLAFFPVHTADASPDRTDLLASSFLLPQLEHGRERGPSYRAPRQAKPGGPTTSLARAPHEPPSKQQ